MIKKPWPGDPTFEAKSQNDVGTFCSGPVTRKIYHSGILLCDQFGGPIFVPNDNNVEIQLLVQWY